MTDSKLFDITVELLVETPKAWRVSDGTKTDWLPKSQCEMHHVKGSTYELTAPEWLLRDKGFI